MEALEHQAGILFRTLILAHITGRDVPYLSGEALAGLVQIRDEMGILTGEFRRINVSGSVQTSYLHKYGPDFPAPALRVPSTQGFFFLLLIYGIHFCQYAAQSVHGNLLIHVLAPGLG